MLEKLFSKTFQCHYIFRFHDTRSSRHHEIPKGETSSSRSFIQDMLKYLADRQYENKDAVDQILPGSHDPRGKFIFERMLGNTMLKIIEISVIRI